MEETRDIAVEARASSASAHHRLDKMNGSIDRLTKSHEKMREDFAKRNEKLVEDFSNTTIMLVTDLAGLRVTLSNALKVAAVAVSLIVAVAAGVVVYQITHWHSVPAPTQTAQIHK